MTQVLERTSNLTLDSLMTPIGLQKSESNPLDYICTDSNFVADKNYSSGDSIHIYVVHNPDRRKNGRQNVEGEIIGFSTNSEDSAYRIIEALTQKCGSKRNIGLVVENNLSGSIYVGYLNPFQNPNTEESLIKTSPNYAD